MTHRTLGPGLESMIYAAWGHFDWNILIATEWGDDCRPVSKLDHVLRAWREESLQNSYAAVENRSAFSARLCVHKYLVVLHEVGMDALNVRGRRGVQVSRAQIAPKLVGFCLWSCIRGLCTEDWVDVQRRGA